MLTAIDNHLQVPSHRPDVVVAYVQRYRRQPDDVRRTEVRDHAAGDKRLGDPPRVLVGDADVAAPPLGLPRRSHTVVVGLAAQHLVDQIHQVPRDLEALLTYVADAGLRHHAEAALDGRRAQHRRGPYLPRRRRPRRIKLGPHLEHGAPVITEPARQSRHRAEVAAVHV